LKRRVQPPGPSPKQSDIATAATAQKPSKTPAVQRSSKQVLQGTKRLLSTLVETAPAGIAVLDRAGAVILWNQSAERVFGWKAQEVLGQFPPEVPPERMSESLRVLADVLGGATFQGEVHRVRKDGTAVDVHMSGSPLRDGRGKIWGALGIFTDVTKQKRAEQALRESEERFRLLYEDAPLGYQSLDADGRFLEINRAWLDMLGYNREEVIGKWFGDFLSPESRELLRQRFPRFKERGYTQGAEFTMVRKDGSAVLVSLDGRAARNLDGSFMQSHCILYDISERKQAEQALRGSEERYRTLVTNTPAIICTHDLGGTLLSVNPAAAAALGYEPADLVGRNLRDILAPSVRHLLDGYLEHIQREPAQSGQMRVITRTGEERAWIYHNVLFAESGKAPYVIGGALDITERRRAEEARRESEERLQFVACAANDVVWDWDLTTNRVWWNDAIRTRFGYSAQETETDSSWWAERIHPDDRDRILSGGRRRETGDDFRMDEYRFRRAEGDFAYVLDRSYVVRDHLGTPVRVIGTMVDLTEHEQAEQALRESEAKYRTLFNRVNDAILIFEPESEVILEANEAACWFYGFARDELIGTSLKALTKDVGRGERQIHQILESGSCLNFATVHLDKQGRFIDILASCTAIEYGGKRAVLGINRDVTELRQTEKELRQLSSRLLQIQDQERRRIARELHDTTAQNLTALAMNLSLLLETPGSVGTGKLLADSLSLARLSLDEIRNVSYLLHPPLLDELGLAEALGIYTTGFSQRTGIQVNLQVRSEFPRLLAELETTVFRIVQESLSNIHRHSGSPTADIGVRLAGSSVVLEVRDQGCGMHAQRSDAGTGGAAELGVGITGMRERVAQLGGRLEIESEGRGVTVRAILPINQGES
jgi:PAS domain S-box-containing protein